MNEQIYSHREYQQGMEIIQSDLMEHVCADMTAYCPSACTADDVMDALRQKDLSAQGFGALLSDAADDFLEQMAQKAKQYTARYFGNNVSLFTPLYLSNYCENICVYCGFSSQNRIQRAQLTAQEMEKQLVRIAKTGLQEILLLTGESPHQCDIGYLCDAVCLAKKYFSTIGLEVYPMNVEEYKQIHRSGADFVSVYQETYDMDCYDRNHQAGPKRSFPYRFDAQERAMMGGMRGVAFGALLGLADFRKDAYAMGIHASRLQKKYPHAELSFSFPRLRSYGNTIHTAASTIGERELLRIMLACRLWMPFAGITISTRERPLFRDHVAGMAATKMSAGVCMEIASDDKKGDAQFDIADHRSVAEIQQVLLSKGLQPVFHDHICLNQ